LETGSRILGSKLAGKSFRKHILWYTKGLDNSHKFREIAGKLKNEEEIQNELIEYFRSLEKGAN